MNWHKTSGRLVQTGQACPDLDAARFFGPDETRGAYLLAKKKQPATPTARRIPNGETGQ